jgi:hypothetical protein
LMCPLTNAPNSGADGLVWAMLCIHVPKTF